MTAATAVCDATNHKDYSVCCEARQTLVSAHATIRSQKAVLFTMAFNFASLQVEAIAYDSIDVALTIPLLPFLCRPIYLGPSNSPYVFTAPPFEAVLKLRAGSNDLDEEDEGVSHGSAAGVMNEQPHVDANVAALDQQDSAETDCVMQSHASPNQHKKTLSHHQHRRFTPPVSSCGFSLYAMSFQCVWFVCLGERHQKPIVQWWEVQAAAAASNAAACDGTAAAASDATAQQSSPLCRIGGRAFSCVIAVESASLPVLTAVTPM